MLKKYIQAAMAGMLLVMLAAIPAAQAQLAKSGSYSLHDGWTASGRAIEVGEAHMYWVGEFKGAGRLLIDGVLFKHYGGDCSAANDIIDGMANVSGYCRFTDEDGDLLFAKFGAQSPAGGPTMVGSADFIAGTGKYTGIRAHHDFTCYNVGTSEISCLGEGKYELP